MSKIILKTSKGFLIVFTNKTYLVNYRQSMISFIHFYYDIAMAKTDFLSWDDDFNNLELDFLLGDYTDDDSSACNVKSSESSECDKGYKCPICNKVLKSISGFRGHTSKQHGKSDLKG